MPPRGRTRRVSSQTQRGFYITFYSHFFLRFLYGGWLMFFVLKLQVGLRRQDAAIDAMKQLGFEPGPVKRILKRLLQVYGGDEGWVFIEEHAYKLLIEAILENPEQIENNPDDPLQECDVGQSSNTGTSNEVPEDAPTFAAEPSGEPPNDALAPAGESMTAVPVIRPPQPLDYPPKQRRPCYGWISDGPVDTVLDLRPMMLLPKQLEHLIGKMGRREKRKSRWDIMPEDILGCSTRSYTSLVGVGIDWCGYIEGDDSRWTSGIGSIGNGENGMRNAGGNVGNGRGTAGGDDCRWTGGNGENGRGNVGPSENVGNGKGTAGGNVGPCSGNALGDDRWTGGNGSAGNDENGRGNARPSSEDVGNGRWTAGENIGPSSGNPGDEDSRWTGGNGRGNDGNGSVGNGENGRGNARGGSSSEDVGNDGNAGNGRDAGGARTKIRGKLPRKESAALRQARRDCYTGYSSFSGDPLPKNPGARPKTRGGFTM